MQRFGIKGDVAQRSPPILIRPGKVSFECQFAPPPHMHRMQPGQQPGPMPEIQPRAKVACQPQGIRLRRPARAYAKSCQRRTGSHRQKMSSADHDTAPLPEYMLPLNMFLHMGVRQLFVVGQGSDVYCRISESYTLG